MGLVEFALVAITSIIEFYNYKLQKEKKKEFQSFCRVSTSSSVSPCAFFFSPLFLSWSLASSSSLFPYPIQSPF